MARLADAVPSWARPLLAAVALAVAWQAAAWWVGDARRLPGIGETLGAIQAGALDGTLANRVATSLGTLVLAYLLALLGAALLTGMALASRIGAALLGALAPLLGPLPGIVLVPLVVLTGGSATTAIVAAVVHAVLWAVTRQAHAGLRAVPAAQRRLGRNAGLDGARLLVHVLVPAAFPAILGGLATGWALAWRALIGAELLTAALTASGGLGGLLLDTGGPRGAAPMFAGLAAILAVGALVESQVVDRARRWCQRRWGTAA